LNTINTNKLVSETGQTAWLQIPSLLGATTTQLHFPWSPESRSHFSSPLGSTKGFAWQVLISKTLWQSHRQPAAFLPMMPELMQ